MCPRVAVASALVFCTLSTAQARADEPKPKPDDPSAAQILERMGKAYSECKTYRDSGNVKTEFIRAEPGGNFTSNKPFTTAFVRPDKFRYEFKDTKAGGQISRFLIWGQGDDIRTWWDVQPGVTKYDSLDTPVAMGTGISGGSAHTVPALLLSGKRFGSRLTELTDAKRIDDAKLGEADCYRVEGKYGNQPCTLWVDKASYLVRRIDQKTTFADFRTEQTTTYEPVADAEVDTPRLKFDPPEPK